MTARIKIERTADVLDWEARAWEADAELSALGFSVEAWIIEEDSVVLLASK